MKLEFKDVINRENGSSAIVVGLGPSLKSHIEKINQLSNKFVIIGCNDIDIITPINFHYWVWANSEATIDKTYTRLNDKPSIVAVVYADSVDLTPRKDVDKYLSINYLPFDQRHFESKNCQYGLCCHHVIQGRLTIQEEFKKYTNYHMLNPSCDTVVIHMLYLSVLLGCKNIYVTGVDLDYSHGYVNGENPPSHVIKEMRTVQSRILDVIKFINDSAKNIGVNIYCLDQGLPISNILEHATLP